MCSLAAHHMLYSNWLRVKVLRETDNTTSFNSESTNWHLHFLKTSPGSNCDQEGLRSDVRLKNTEETNRHEHLSKNFLIGFYLSEFTISRLSRVQIPPPPEGCVCVCVHPNQWSPMHSLFHVTPQSQHHSALHRGHCMCMQPPAEGDNTLINYTRHNTNAPIHIQSLCFCESLGAQMWCKPLDADKQFCGCLKNIKSK